MRKQARTGQTVAQRRLQKIIRFGFYLAKAFRPGGITHSTWSFFCAAKNGKSEGIFLDSGKTPHHHPDTTKKNKMSAGQGSAGNIIAALVNVPFPGLGQLIQGRLLSALLFFIFTYGSYALWFLLFPLVIGGVLHLWSILDAALWKPKRA